MIYTNDTAIKKFYYLCPIDILLIS